MIENIGAYSQFDYDRGYQQGRADVLNNLMDIRIELGLVNDESITRLFGKYEQLKSQTE